MDNDSLVPVVVFGAWLCLMGVFLLISVRTMRRLVRDRIAVYGKPHEWRSANVLAFPRLKQGFYDDCQAALESAGFKLVGDIEDATLATTRDNPNTFRRVMLSPDGQAVAEFWQVNFSPWKQLFNMVFKGLGDARFIRIFAEAADGRIFETGRAPLKKRPLEPERFEVRYVDGKPGADEVWARFTGDFATYRESRPDFAPRSFKFLDEVVDSENRQQAAVIDHRKTVGLLTREELLLEGMPSKSVDGYLKAFGKQLKKMGGWPQ